MDSIYHILTSQRYVRYNISEFNQIAIMACSARFPQGLAWEETP
jgi:hypothetical protein